MIAHGRILCEQTKCFREERVHRTGLHVPLHPRLGLLTENPQAADQIQRIQIHPPGQLAGDGHRGVLHRASGRLLAWILFKGLDGLHEGRGVDLPQQIPVAAPLRQQILLTTPRRK